MVKRLASALVLSALVVTAGCRPSSPDQQGWQSSAEKSVSDMVSQVATSRLTLRLALHDRLVARYGVVALTYSEDAAGKAAESVSTLQPPPGARPGYDELTGLLSDATDAISHSRIALVDGDEEKSRAAIRTLTGLLGKLRPLLDRLEAETR